MWLTRNLCSKICRCLASNLEKTVVDLKEESIDSRAFYELLEAEHQTAIDKIDKKNSQNENNFPKPKSNKPIRLCSSVNVSFGKIWRLQFFCAEENNSFEIKTDRQNIHQILSALIKKCDQACWNIKDLPSWRITNY